jgi:hypothetical protein
MGTKDHVKLAEALANAKPRWAGQMESAVWEDCRTQIANTLASDNPRFNRESFMQATEGTRPSEGS